MLTIRAAQSAAFNLRRFQVPIRHLLGDAMERLAGELRGTQARDSRQTVLEELRQVSLRSCCAHPLERHRKHHLAH
jgi:hypothetical protein